MASRTAPFSRFEWLIAWRYVRARRAEGGVSVMTWISLIGIMLAVFALIATLGVRSGFRADLVDTIVGANPHIALSYNRFETIEVTQGDQTVSVDRQVTVIEDPQTQLDQLRALPQVVSAFPVIEAQGLLSRGAFSTFVQVQGIAPEDLSAIPLVANPMSASGDLADFGTVEEGIALGSGVARTLGVQVGDRVTLLVPEGVQTAVRQSPRRATFEVVHVVQTGRVILDNSQIFMPLDRAQGFFNRVGVVDAIHIFTADPDRVEEARAAVVGTLTEPGWWVQTWQDFAGSYLRALTVEDNVMFILMSILVLIASMNIISGLVMLVKNKGRDIGILRTIGLTEGSILRIFFLCGAGIGTMGTLMGVALGCLFVLYIDPIFSFVNWLGGGGVWDPSIRGIYDLPAVLRFGDVMSAVVLSLAISWIITIFPARRAARMNPVEALRYE